MGKLHLDVLVVDDDDDLCQLFKTLLETEGYKCAVAHNGLTALQTLAVVPPRVMLLDLVMPVMDGFSVLNRLGTDAPPVIVISGATIPGDLVVNRHTHVRSLLQKPVYGDVLIETVRQVLASEVQT
jgi:CheY-like chemotaxis protein